MQFANFVTTWALVAGVLAGICTAVRFWRKHTELTTDFCLVWLGQVIGLAATLVFSTTATWFSSNDFSAVWAILLRWLILLGTVLPMMRMGWKLEHDREFIETVTRHTQEAQKLVRELKHGDYLTPE